VNAAPTRARPTTPLDISQMNTAQLYPQIPKHSKWLKNTISTFYNLRLAVPSFASREFLRKLSCNNRISSIFTTEHLSVGLRCFTQGRLLTKAYKTHDNGLAYFLPTKQWFGMNLPKAMKTCLKATLRILTHTVGGICDSSRQKLAAPNLAATSDSLSPRKSMRWSGGSNDMIVEPILLTSKKLKSSSLKNRVWPIGYFPIALSVLVAFDHHRYNKINWCIMYILKLQQPLLICFCKFSWKSEIIIG